MKKPTIYDVAKAAGVSIATVSRVLNDDPAVKPQTRDSVLATITAIGYRPNLSARSTGSGRSRWVALLYQNPVIHYIHPIQQGAVERCRQDGHLLSVHACQHTGDALVDEVLGIVDQLQPRGLVLTLPLSISPALCEALRARDTPFVRIAPQGLDDPSARVYFDENTAAAAMTRQLLAAGHRRIGFLAGLPEGHPQPDERRAGHLRALAEAGIRPNAGLLACGSFHFEESIEPLRTMLGRRQRPTAVFCANDDMAAAALQVAAELGLRVPQDLSVAGFDDSYVARIVTPRLTTVRQPLHEMGWEAVDLILRGQAQPVMGQQRILPWQMVAGQSTADAPQDTR
ncbi:LacI family DNA-binding transcriptional regulator [Pseudaquabacterium rugosum]|jgi:LacI family transcriptional regulator|uniref:LacI family DNA-binding transcriptional regulator n=1 Tax=Pseudaquabacterium rugosum TaxID=2984194 RepID=A0ABU9BBS6_9BURK